MSPVRTARLFGPVAVPTGAYGTLFTCPPDRTARILCLGLTNNGGAANGILLRRGEAGFLGWWNSGAVGVGLSVVVPMVWVLNEGETVQGIAGGSGLVLWASGSLLLGDSV